jgi:hypothetical protein
VANNLTQVKEFAAEWRQVKIMSEDFTGIRAWRGAPRRAKTTGRFGLASMRTASFTLRIFQTTTKEIIHEN